MAVLAFPGGVLPVCDSAAIASAQVLHASPAATAQTEFYAEMRTLWGQHMDGTWAVVVAFADDPVALLPRLDRLLRNQVDIGNAFAPYYGQEVARQLTGLLTIHILQAVPVLTATRIGYKPALDRAVADWHANARDIADFFAGLNPNWPQQDMREALGIHIDQTVADSGAVIGGRNSEATATFDEAKAHMMGFADVLSQGIVTQFPDRF
ncbi:hypothetical protein [Nocardia anaemiae]|uniref:hypothetical protein n=1 Tax=Nocardia anaemiae TaxID=263910 RepID=UPI0007A51C88|nr:hypothetical protein [Nocardia anaemiae]